MQDPRVVPGGPVAKPYVLGHNLGLGGSCVVTLLRRPDFYQAGQKPDGQDRVGYSHGHVCKPVTTAECVVCSPSCLALGSRACLLGS